ncbi:hypothetical protein ACFFMN_30905 [Planobispora siamensis]|uniref:Uncharacterized protein n=1 Tax=Planobispora siamensis TaxID=936338 RepID=A0A8J3SE20_9ACTN|nr:hypothetical protein [Planobispora siamensis]GIH91395.1 hypothetical protein Psi01_20250 [Planobispora siamensis]
MSEMDVNETTLEEIDDALSGEIGTEIDVETPEADAAEQHRSMQEERSAWPDRIPFDADPADAADQTREVGIDEDDYR